MLELLTGDAVFGKSLPHCSELTVLAKIVLASLTLLAAAALIMTVVSLLSFVATGAPFIATSRRLTRQIVALGGIQSGEVVYDIGCGDGRFLIEASKSYGAEAFGIEISPVVCALARITAWLYRADITTIRANFKDVDLSKADVVFCYLGNDQMAVLREKCQNLKKGCRVVSRRFGIPGREPQQQVRLKTRFGSESVFIYRF